jgi:hypothetical protein
MKKNLYPLLAFFIFLFSGYSSLANKTAITTYYSRANGSWNVPSSWSTIALGGPIAAAFPGPGDNVVIGNGFGITLNTNENCSSLNLSGPGGSLNMIGGSSLTVGGTVSGVAGTTLAMNAGTVLHIAGDFNYSGTFLPGGGTVDLNSPGGATSFSPLGYSNFQTSGSGSRSVLAGPGWSVSNITIGAGTTLFNSNDLTVNGTWINDGSFFGSSAAVNFTGASPQTISGAGLLTTGNFTINGAGGLTNLSSTNNLTVFGDLLINAGSGGLSGGSSVINIDGNWTNNGTFNGGTGSINFEGTAAQNISGSNPTTFNDLAISNSAAPVFTNISITANTTSIGSATSILDLTTITGHDLGTISGTGTLALSASPGGNTMFPSGTFTNFLAPGGSGKVMYNSGNSYNITANNFPLGLSYSDILITGGGAKTINVGMTATNLFHNDIATTINHGGGVLDAQGVFQNDGTFNSSSTLLVGGLVNGGTGIINNQFIIEIQNDLDNNNPAIGGWVSGSSSLVRFNSFTDQHISGNPVPFNDFEITKSPGSNVILNTPVSIAGVLNFTGDGNFFLNNNDLTLGPASTIPANSFSPARMIDVTTGRVVKQATASGQIIAYYPIGFNTVYTPLDINGGTFTFAGTGNLFIQAFDYGVPYTATDYANRYLRLSTTNFSTVSDFQFIYQFGTNPSDYTNAPVNVIRYVAGTPNPVAGQFKNLVGPYTYGVTAAGNNFIDGDWVLESALSSGKTFTGASTNLWSDANSWSPVGLPVATDDVIINADCFVQAASGVCNNMTVNAGITLTVDGDILTVNGNLTGPGDLAMTSSASLLSLNRDNTTTGAFTPGSGTFRYNSSSANQVIRGGLTYYNLDISGIGNSVLNNNITIDGGLLIFSGALDAASYRININGDWTQNSTFNPGTGLVFFEGALPQQIQGSVGSINFNTLVLNKNSFSDPVNVTLPIIASQSLINTGTLDLGTITTHNLGTVSSLGSGTIALSAPPNGNTYFPDGNYTNFLGAGNGTVFYNSTDDYVITANNFPAGLNYNTLRIGGGAGTKTLASAITFNTNWDFQLDAGTNLDLNHATLNVSHDLFFYGNTTNNGGGAAFVNVTGNFFNSGNMSFSFGQGLFTLYGDMTNTSFSFMGGDMQFVSTTADQTINCINCNFISLALNKSGKRLILNGATPSSLLGNVDFQSDGIFELRSELQVKANIGGPQKITTSGSFGPNRMIITNGGDLMLGQGSNANFTGKFLPLGTPSGLYVPFTFTNAGGTASGCNIVFSAFDYTPPFTDFVKAGITINADGAYTTVQDIEFSIGFGPGDVQGSPADLLLNGAVHTGYVNIPGQSFGVNALGNTDLSGTWTAATLSAPVITSFNPNPTCEGSTVTITGSSFTGTTDVLINGTSVGGGNFTENSGTQITMTVPVGATSGLITVTAAGGSGSSAGSLTVTTGFTVPDANFVTWLTANYPACMCGNVMDTTCAAITSETFVNVTSLGVSDLSGIEYFTSLTYLNCAFNSLTGLPALPSTLQTLTAANNLFASLPPLPAALSYLDCSHSLLSGLPAIPSGLVLFDCSYNSINVIPALPSGVQYLYCNNNLLTSLPSPLPTSLLMLICSDNSISGLPVLPAGLTDLRFAFNSVSSLPASLPSSLQVLWCNSNSLSTLPTLPNTLGSLVANTNIAGLCYPNTPTTPFGGTFSADIALCGSGPVITSFSSPDLCEDGSVTVTGSGFSTVTDITMNGVSISSWTIIDDFTITIFPGIGQTTDFVTITNAGGSATSSTSLIIYPLPAPAISYIGSPDFCTGGNLPMDAGAGFASYQWNYSGSPLAGETTQNYSAIAGGDHSVFVTDGNGCSATSPIVKVGEILYPTPNISTTDPTTTCAGNNVHLVESSGSYTYNWMRNGASISGTTGQPSYYDENTTTGDYSVLATVGPGCSTMSNIITLTFSPAPSAGGVLTGPVSVCPNQTGVAYSFPADPDATNYVWYVPSDAAIVSGNGTTDIVVDFGVISDNVAVYAQNACGNGPTIGNAVTVLSSPTATAGADQNLCPLSTAPLTGTFTNATSATWSGGLGTFSPDNDAFSNSIINYTADPSEYGQIIPLTLTATGCGTDFSTLNLYVQNLVTATITSGDATICNAQPYNVQITFTSTNPTQIWWDFNYSDDGGTTSFPVSAATNPYTLSSFSSPGSITYSLMSVDDPGPLCPGTVSSNVATITTNPNPVVTTTDPSPACTPNTVDLTNPSVTSGSTAGLTFNYWDDNAASISETNPTAISSAGTYYIQGVDGAGCSDIQAVNVQINPSPTVLITDPAAVCSPLTVDLTDPAITSGSTAGLSFSYWDDAGSITPEASPSSISASGIYYIRGDDIGFCYDIKPVNVTVNPAPIVTITDPATICPSTTADITAPAVIAGSDIGLTFSYWQDAAATIPEPSASALGAGTYYIKGTDAASCFTIAAVNVTASTPISATTSKADVSCFGSNDGAINIVSPTGGSGFYENSVDNGSSWQASANFGGLIAGSYDVVVRDQLNTSCFVSLGTVTLTEPAANTATLSAPTTATVCAGGTTDFTVTVTGTGPFSFDLSNGTDVFNFTGQGSPSTVTVSPTVTADWSVINISDAGCAAAGSFGLETVTVNPAPTATISGGTSICAAGSDNLTITFTGGPGPWDFDYFDGVSTSTITGVGTPYTLVVSPAATTTYTITSVTEGTCAGTFGGSATTTVNPAPTANISGGTGICPAGSDNLTVTFAGGAGPWDFDYFDGVSTTTITGVGTPYTLVVSPASTTTYTITSVTEGACTGTFGGSATTTVNPAPTATISGGTSICPAGSDNLTVTFTGNGGPWDFDYFDGVSTTTITGVGTPYTLVVSPASTTTYTITSVTEGACTGTFGGSATTTVNPVPTATISGGTSICAAGSDNLTITFTGGAGPWDFDYFDGVSNTTITGASTPYTLVVSPASTSTYTISSVTEGLCSGTFGGSATTTVIPAPTANISGGTTICTAGSDNLTVTFAGNGGPWDFDYFDGVSTTTITGVGTPYTFVVSPTSTTTYTITSVTEGVCTGTFSGSATTTINPAPTATISGGTSICPSGSDNLTVTFTGGPGPWDFDYFDGVSTTTITGVGTPYTLVVSPASTTTYTITSVTEGACIGTFSGSATTTINPAPAANISGGTTICGGASDNLTVTFTGNGGPWGFDYFDGVLTTTITGATTPYSLVVSPAATTTYTITSVTEGSCTGTFGGSATTTVNPAPTATISGGTTICTAGSDNLTVTFTGNGGPWDFDYFDGTSTTTITGVGTPYTLVVSPTSTTTYTITSVTEGVCTGTFSGSATTTINPAATATMSGGTSICAGGSDNLTITFTGGPGPWDFDYFDGGSTTTITGVTSPYTLVVSPATTTAYTITSVTEGACIGTFSGSATTTVNPAPTANAGVDQSGCAGSAYTLNGSANFATSTTWSGGAGIFTPDNLTLTAIYTPTLAEESAGTVTLTLTSASAGCTSATDQMVITIVPAATANANADQTGCAGSSYPLGGVATNATTTTWSGGAGTFNPDNLTLNAVYTPTPAEETAGTVTLTLTSAAAGCASATDQMVITITSNAISSLAVTPSSNVCIGSNGTVTITASEAGVSYTPMIGVTQVGSSVTGTGANINLTIIESNLTNGANTIAIQALKGSCSPVNLTNTSTITYDNSPAPVIVSTSNQLCSGAAIIASVPSGATGYQWFLNVSSTIIGANLNNYNVVTPGSYTVKITNPSGCIVTTNPKVITNVAAPSIVASGGAGNDTLLTAFAPGATSYQWYAGQKAIMTENAPAYRLYFISDYSVSANINGCRVMSVPYTANNSSMSLLVRMNFISTDSTIYIPQQGISATQQIDVFPNPSNGKFTVNYKCISSKTVSVKIYNTVGGLMAEKNFEKHSGYVATDFDEYTFLPGFYLLYIIENQKTVVKSFCIY